MPKPSSDARITAMSILSSSADQGTILKLPEADRAAVLDFLSAYLSTGLQLVVIKPDSKVVLAKWFGADVEAAADWAVDQNARGLGVYFSVNVVRTGLNQKASKTEVVEARIVHVDIDPKKGLAFDMPGMLRRLDALQCPPSWVIASGGGLAAYWVLDEATANLSMIEMINLQVRRFFDADSAHNIDRIMRLPGTVNFPNSKKRGEGRQPTLACIVREDDGVVYRPDILAAGFPPVEKDDFKSSREAISVGPYALITADDLGLAELSPLRSLIEHPQGDDGSRDAFRCAGAMIREGFSPEQIMGVLMNKSNPVSDHIYRQSDPRYQALRCIAGVTNGCNAEPANERGTSKQLKREPDFRESDGRPTIHIRGGDLHLLATAAERALIEGDAPLYIWNGLVRPIVDEVKAMKGYTSKVARLKAVDADTLVDYLSRSATWTKYDGRAKRDVEIDPPTRIANTVLAREGAWGFPRLAGVITTPTLRPNGTILSQEGYDDDTQLLLLEPPVLPELLDAPTKSDAEAALASLDALLEEFPFVDNASRSVALSALITPVVRGALESAPMHATTAPIRGSGKSYIIDIASAICSGQRAPVLSAGKNEEETEKRVTGDLLTGQALISIDNVNGPLGGAFLCQAVERPLVKVRPLGGSLIVTIQIRVTFFATGNNIQLVDDMTRRVVMCSLDPQMELPEFRKFSGNPLQMVLNNRGAYIAAALTIVRAYIVAGKPGVLPPLASYEDWSDLVRSSLVWLGRADPVETMNKANAEDPVRVALSGLLSAWYDAVAEATHTTATIKAVSDAIDRNGTRIHAALADALQDVGSDDRNSIFSTKRLGRYLGRNHNRIVDGLKLVAGEDTHVKQKTWKVVRA